TYGSQNLRRIGVILQRAILILLLACFPCWAILINTEALLLAVRQEPEVARFVHISGRILVHSSLKILSKLQLPPQIFYGIKATFMYALQTSYLQNQSIIWPPVITGLIVNIFNAGIQYIFIFVLHLGIAGSAAANAISQYCMATTLLAYIIWKGLHKPTWGGWTKECLQDWGSYMYLAIPSMVMTCVQWWAYEIGSLLAGLISEVELGAQSIVYQLANIAYMFPLGCSVAGNVRVGQALGGGDTEQAKLSAKLTIFCAGSMSICWSILLGSLKGQMSYVFSDDEQIRQRVTDVLSIYAPFMILDALSASLGGILRGAGKQKIGAICNLLGFYGVGFPIGVPLMFAAKLGIIGLWIGLIAGVFLQVIFLSSYLLRMNWNKTTTEAQIRAGVVGSSTDTSPQPEDPGHSQDSAGTDTVELVDREAGGAAVEKELGLVLAVMLFILAAGILINLLINNLVT
ncbi:hypothetical protein JOQ06_019213, partial [Pogonophryne albipinna]